MEIADTVNIRPDRHVGCWSEPIQIKSICVDILLIYYRFFTTQKDPVKVVERCNLISHSKRTAQPITPNPSHVRPQGWVVRQLGQLLRQSL